MTTINVHEPSLIENMTAGATDADAAYLEENFERVRARLREIADECGVALVFQSQPGGALHRSFTLAGDSETSERDFALFAASADDLWTAL